jgi:hypothetical protein
MAKKTSKPCELPPNPVEPDIQVIRMGSATSELPQPIRAAVEGSGGWKVPRILREELAVLILSRAPDDQELASVMDVLRCLRDLDKLPTRPSSAAPSPNLSPKEWEVRAYKRANEVTTEAKKHPFLGLWLQDQPLAWQGLRSSLREAIEAFAGHQGDSRRKRFDSNAHGCDWRWLFPSQPKEKDSNGRPVFAKPMHLALWSWIRDGEVSETDRFGVPNKRQIGKRVIGLRDTILGDCSNSPDGLRIRKSGLLQLLAESFRRNSIERLKLVMDHSLERADGTRIDPTRPVRLPIAVIEPLLAGESLEKAGIQVNRRTHDNTDIYSRMSKIRRKPRLSG